jgi:hypothetical protein
MPILKTMPQHESLCPNRHIQLITSRNHDAFNLVWGKQLPEVPPN